MAGEKEASRRGLDLEWQVTVSGPGSSVKLEAQPALPLAALWICNAVSSSRLKAWSFGRRVWQIGADDPRKVIYGMKVGLALVLTSLFYYTRPLYDGVGGTAMWAVMTVVVVFEFTVGTPKRPFLFYMQIKCMHGSMGTIQFFLLFIVK